MAESKFTPPVASQDCDICFNMSIEIEKSVYPVQITGEHLFRPIVKWRDQNAFRQKVLCGHYSQAEAIREAIKYLLDSEDWKRLQTDVLTAGS